MRSGRRAIIAGLAVAVTALLGCRLRPAEQEQGAAGATQVAQPKATEDATEAAGAAPAGQGRAAEPSPAEERPRRQTPALQIGYPALPVDELVASLRGGVVNLRTTVPVKRGPGAIYPGAGAGPGAGPGIVSGIGAGAAPGAGPGSGSGTRAGDEGSLGSGVIIAMDAPAAGDGNAGGAGAVRRQVRILTNDHVIAQARDIRVRLVDGSELPARVIGRAPELDVALLAVDSDRPLEPLPLGESSSLRVGEWVVALGNPFGHEVMAHVGVMASVDGAGGAADAPPGTGNPYREFLVVDVAIHAANSGGPLVDTTGRVVGINVAAAPGGSAIGFAVPIDRVAAVLEMLERDGRIQHAWLGVYIQPLTPELAAQRGLEGKGGALVSEVRPGTPGARAGLAPDDVILRFDGQAVDHRDLPWRVSAAGAGRRIPIVIQRDGAERELEIVSELRPQ
jgi:serine protease Do